METLKAGCILVDKQNKKIALIYRDKLNDYSFPKGHLEQGESLKECAVRETAEETKRVAVLLEQFEPHIERYTTPKGENCVCYLYIALDKGPSDNTSEDTHDVHWIDFDKVESVLTYDNLKATWNALKEKVATVF